MTTLQKYTLPAITPSTGGWAIFDTTGGSPTFNPGLASGFFPTAPYAALRTFINGEGVVEKYPESFIDYRLNYELLTYAPPLGGEEITQLIGNALHGQFDVSRPYVYLTANFNRLLPIPGPPPSTPEPEIFLQYLTFAWDSGAFSVDSFAARVQITFSVDAGMFGVVGLTSGALDAADPNTARFGIFFRTGLHLTIIQDGVLSAPSVPTLVNAATRFAIRYVDGAVTYLADNDVIHQTTSNAGPAVLRGVVSLYGARSRVTDATIQGFSRAALHLPLQKIVHAEAQLTLPPLTASAGWLPYANTTLPALTARGGAPLSYAALLIPRPVAEGIWRGFTSGALPKLLMAGGAASIGRLKLKLALSGGDVRRAQMASSLPALTARGLAGRPVPLGGMALLPRIRGVGRGTTSNLGQSESSKPALTMRSANYSAAAGQLRPLRVFGFADRAGEAFISGAPLGDAAVTPVLFVVVQLDSTGSVVDALAVQIVLSSTLDSVATATDPTSVSALLSAAIDGVLLGASFQPLSDQGAETWVVNADTGASTSYENYSFNSFATIGGKLYGARSDGVYLLEGNTDAGLPIRASMSFGKTDFGTTMLKRMESAYVGVSSTGTMYLKISYQDGQSNIYTTRRNDDYMAVQRVDVGRGIKASYLGFEIYNSDGNDFELNTVSFVAAELTRRV